MHPRMRQERIKKIIVGAGAAAAVVAASGALAVPHCQDLCIGKKKQPRPSIRLRARYTRWGYFIRSTGVEHSSLAELSPPSMEWFLKVLATQEFLFSRAMSLALLTCGGQSRIAGRLFSVREFIELCLE
eukprot:IDg3873t1